MDKPGNRQVLSEHGDHELVGTSEGVHLINCRACGQNIGGGYPFVVDDFWRCILEGNGKHAGCPARKAS